MKKEEKIKLPEVTFQAPTFSYIEKSKDWYWILWIVFIAISIAAFIVQNYTFATLVVLCAFVLSLLATKRPENITISFTNTHVHIGTKKYKISDFESYNLIPEENRVLLKYTKPYLPIVIVPIGDRPPEGELRNYLAESAWEEDDELQEPFIELVLEKLGF